jgi:uncharacterized alkaline shock family protein YloU
MKVIARLILVLLGLLFIGVGLYILACSFDLAGGTWGTSLLGLVGMPVFVAIAGGCMVVGLILLSLGLRSTGEKKVQTILQTSEYGEIRIAIVAIENMVLRVVQQTHGVKDIGRKVGQTPQGLTIIVRIRVMPDLQLPGLISGLQEKIKNYVEEITGFIVRDVQVTVENIIIDQVPVKGK